MDSLDNQFITSLSVILPAYNEEAVIAETIAGALAYASKCRIPFEVVVVNDGSHDRTRTVVEDLQRTHAEIRLVNHTQNKGYGEALRSGFNAASMDWLFLMDSDGQFDIAQLDEFMPYTHKHDMVLGFRERRADALYRVLYGWGFTFLMNLFFDMHYKDIDCAFKLLRRSAWKAVQPIASTDHKIFTFEWLWRAKRAGLHTKELPVRHYPRTKGTQTGARADVIWQMIRSLAMLRLGLPQARPVEPENIPQLYTPADLRAKR